MWKIFVLCGFLAVPQAAFSLPEECKAKKATWDTALDAYHKAVTTVREKESAYKRSRGRFFGSWADFKKGIEDYEHSRETSQAARYKKALAVQKKNRNTFLKAHAALSTAFDAFAKADEALHKCMENSRPN